MTNTATSHFDEVWPRKHDADGVAVRYTAGQNERVDKALDILPTGDSLLDIGCGTGLLCAQAKDRFQSVYGIDIAVSPVETARSLGVKPVVADFGNFDLPFSDDAFDVVTSLSSIQYAMEPLAFLRECRRVMKPGGKLVISVPNMRTVGKIYRLVVRGEFPTVSKDAVGHDGGTLRYFCYRDLANLLEDAGFAIESRYGIYCRPHPFARFSDTGPLAFLKQEFFSGELFVVGRNRR